MNIPTCSCIIGWIGHRISQLGRLVFIRWVVERIPCTVSNGFMLFNWKYGCRIIHEFSTALKDCRHLFCALKLDFDLVGFRTFTKALFKCIHHMSIKG
jgi:hypothetical protein